MMAIASEAVSTRGACTASMKNIDAAMGTKIGGGVVEIQGALAAGAYAFVQTLQSGVVIQVATSRLVW